MLFCELSLDHSESVTPIYDLCCAFITLGGVMANIFISRLTFDCAFSEFT